jgi:hypothetical protein
MGDGAPWGYQRDALVDRALRRMECASKGHRWWRVLDLRVCGNCGRIDR